MVIPNQNTKISCIIPTCNRSAYILDAIRSVLNQTRPPDEIIIVNNGYQLVDLPTELLARVKIYDIIPYAGAAQARNFGFSLAMGDYLAPLDDDDMWPPNYLANVEAAIMTGAKCIISRMDKLVDGQISFYKNPGDQITIANLLVKNPGAGGPNVVIQKKLFFKVGGYDPKLPPSEDKAMVLEVLRTGERVVTLPDNYIIVRIHGGERLTNHKSIAEGIFQFTRKYKHLMTKRQYLFNWLKIMRHRYQAGQKKALLYYLPLKIIYSFYSVFQRRN